MPYFDPTDVPPHETFTPLPVGWYHVVIIGSEPHYGKTPGAGEMLKLTVEVDANEHPDAGGRQVFSYLCINHQNATPRNIARRHLSAICHSLELFPMESPEELLGAKLMVRLKIRPAEGDYEAGNDIASWAAPGNEKTDAAPKSGKEKPATAERQPASRPGKVDPPKPAAAKPGGWKR